MGDEGQALALLSLVGGNETGDMLGLENFMRMQGVLRINLGGFQGLVDYSAGLVHMGAIFALLVFVSSYTFKANCLDYIYCSHYLR